MQQAIDSLEAAPRMLALYPETRRWLIEQGAPDDLIELLRAFPFSSATKFGRVYFSEVNRIPEYNDQPENALLKASGLLAIGDGLNGDPIVVNLTTGTIGFVSHDELWEETARNIGEIYCDLGLSIGEFFLAAATQVEFPVDYYEASEFGNTSR